MSIGSDRPVRRRALQLSGAVAAGAFVLTACGGGDDSGSSSSASDSLVEAVPALPAAFAYDVGAFGYEGFEFQINTQAQLVKNPYVPSDRPGGTLEQDFYTFEGELAESYEVSDDGLVYTFHLRRGVLSAAGNELTSDDVLWSYERKWNSTSVAPFISLPAIYDPATQFEKIDDYTFTITIDRPGDGFTLLSLLANVSGDIFDSDLLKEHASPDDPYAVEWSAQDGNYGYGAYTLESFTPGQSLVLKANPNYYAGEPAIETITQRVVADPGTRTNLLRNGDVDVAVQLRPADVAELSGEDGMSTFEVNTNNYVWLNLNTESGPFSDVRVRQALSYAVPYEQIIDQVYKGRADPMKGFINPNYPGYTTDGLRQGTYDPERAKGLLADAAHTEPLPVTLLISNAVPDLQEASVQIQSAAADAGFEVSIDQLPPTAVAEARTAGNYEAQLVRDLAISQSPPYELLLSLTKDSPLNVTRWSNDAYYAAAEKGIAAGDALSPQAGQHWNEAMRIWQEELPTIPIAFVQPLAAFGAGVEGFAHRSEGTIDFSVVTKGGPA